MSSKTNKDQTDDKKKIEYQVQKDAQYLLQQQQVMDTQQANVNMTTTSAMAQQTANAQVRYGNNAAVSMLTGMVRSMVLDPAKAMAQSYNPFAKFEYAPYHPGFWANIGSSFGDMQARTNVEHSLAMLGPRLAQTLGFVSGSALIGSPIDRGLGGGVSALVRNLTGKAWLGSLASFGVWGVPVTALGELTTGAVNIGAFSQMGYYAGLKYRTALTSDASTGIGFSPREALRFGTDMYKFTKESGYGFKGYAGEMYSSPEVEAAFKALDSSGLFRDATTITDMMSKMKALLGSYKSVAKELHLTAESAMGVSTSLMSLGFNTAPSIVGASRDVGYVARFTGQSYNEAYVSGMSGAQAFLSAGLERTAGWSYGLRSNEYLSYMYQTHAAQMMPQELGGYSQALGIQNQLQMSLLSNPQFRNAALIAQNAGGGYDADFMKRLIATHPAVLSFYGKKALGHTPTQIYANLWKVQGPMSEAMADPTTYARYLRGMMQRARIDLNNQEAVKGYAYNMLIRQGMDPGHARYEADVLAANVKNVNVIDQLETSRYFNIQAPRSTFIRGALGEPFVTGWNNVFGTYHRGVTELGRNINRAGVNIAEGYEDMLERISNRTRLTYNRELSPRYESALLQAGEYANISYIGEEYNPELTGFARGMLEFQKSGKQVLTDQEYGRMLLSNTDIVNPYNNEYMAKKYSADVESAAFLPGVAGVVAGFATGNPFLVAGGALGIKTGAGAFINKIFRHEYNDILFSSDLVQQLDRVIQSQNHGEKIPINSQKWKAMALVILRKMGINVTESQLNNALLHYGPTASHDYVSAMRDLEGKKRMYLTEGHRFYSELKKNIKYAGEMSDEDLAKYIAAYEEWRKHPQYGERFEKIAAEIAKKYQHGEEITGEVEKYLSGAKKLATGSVYSSDMKIQALIGFSTNVLYSSDEMSALAHREAEVLGSSMKLAGAGAGKLISILDKNATFSELDRNEIKSIDNLKLSSSTKRYWEAIKATKDEDAREMLYEKLRSAAETQGGKYTLPQNTAVTKEAIGSMNILVSKLNKLIPLVDKLIQDSKR